MKNATQNECKSEISLLLDSLSDIFILLDKNGKIKFINQSGLKYIGKNESEVIGNELWIFLDNENANTLKQLTDKVTETTKAHDLNYLAESSLYHVKATPFQDENGNIKNIAFQLMNISEFEQNIKKLGKSEELYRLMLSNVTDAIFVTDKNGKFTFVGPNCNTIFGYTAQEIYKLEYVEELFGKEICDYEQVIAKHEIQNINFSFVNKHGETKHLLISVKNVSIYEGVVLYSCRNVTEQKQAEQAYIETEEKYSELVRNANSIIMKTDSKGNITFFNEFAEIFFGYFRDEILNKNIIGTIFPKIDTQGNDQSNFFEKVINSPEQYFTYEYENVRNSGEHVWISWTNNVFYNQNNQVESVLWIGNDLTDKKKAEKQERIHKEQIIQADKLSSLGLLVAGVVHEVNNPNSSILVNASMLEEIWQEILPILDEYNQNKDNFTLGTVKYDAIQSKLPTFIKNILKSSRKIDKIINELKNFARTGSGKRIMKEVNLKKVLDSSISLTRNMIKTTTKNFEFTCTDKIPIIFGDKHKLEQVFVNLIINSCEAIRHESGEIEITLGYDKINNRIVVNIKDNGEGIPEDILKDITSPFVTSKRDIGGSGLGLSVSSKILQEHNGKLNFVSKINEGTTVEVVIDAKEGISND